MNDKEYLEKVLLGKLMGDKTIYYDNHSLLHKNLFSNQQHQKLYTVLDNSLQKNGKCDMTDFYTKSNNKHEAIKLAHECSELAYEPYQAKNLILLLLETNKISELTHLVHSVERKINDKDDLFAILNYAEMQMLIIED